MHTGLGPYLGVLKQLWKVDSLGAQHKLLLVPASCCFIQEAPGNAPGGVDHGTAGQGREQRAHVKVSLHQRQLHCHLQGEHSWAGARGPGHGQAGQGTWPQGG